MVNKLLTLKRKSLRFGVLPLSSPTSPSVVQEAKTFLESEGHKVELLLDPSNDYGGQSHLFASDTADARARALQSALCSDEFDLILAARGGYGAIEVLPKLDLSAISNSSKPLCGFSDASTILAALFQVCGKPAIHGPNLSSFRSEVDIELKRSNLAALIKLLSEERKLLFGSAELSPIRPGDAQGVLLGGNLSAIVALTGTKWAPKFNQRIFFFEEVGEAPFRLHRMLTQLKMSGAFDGLRGVLIGDISSCVHNRGAAPDSQTVIEDVLGELGVPIYCGAGFGHGAKNRAVPVGLAARLSDNGLELL